MMLVGTALGVDWDKVRERLQAPADPQRAAGEMPTLTGPSIFEIGQKMKPPTHGDHAGTLAASVEAIRQFASSETPPLFQ